MNDQDPQRTPPVHFEAGFRAPPVPRRAGIRALVYLAVTILAAVAASYVSYRVGLLDVAPWWTWAALGAAGGVAWCVRLELRTRSSRVGHPIVLSPARLLLPIGPAGREADEVPLEEVQSVDLTERGRRPRLSIGTTRGLYIYPLQAFAPPRAALQLARAIVSAIAARPRGEVQLAEMHRRALVMVAFSRTRPKATKAILSLVAAGFLLQQLFGAFSGSLLEQQVVQLRMGANASALVGQGEWWRLFVANFLHGGWLHILLNGLALLSLGTVLEKLIGTTRFVIVYLASALAGSLASAWAAQGILSLGASTGIFGLLGAFGVMSLRFGRDLPEGVRQSRRWWVIVLLVNGALPLVIAVIDSAAHAGGFLAGAVVVFLVYPSLLRFTPSPPTSVGIRTLALALCGVFVIAAGQPVRAWIEDRSSISQALVLDLVGPDASGELMNQLAWMVVASPSTTSPQTLSAARRLAERAVAAERISHHVDTLATAEHRLGNREKAARLEREAIRLFQSEDRWQNTLSRDELFYSQLARFVLGSDGLGPPIVDGAIDSDEVRLAFEPDGLRVDAPPGLPLVVFAQLRGPGGPRGVLRVGLRTTPREARLLTLPEPARVALQGQVDLHVLWVDTSSAGVEESELGVRFAEHDDEVDDLL